MHNICSCIPDACDLEVTPLYVDLIKVRTIRKKIFPKLGALCLKKYLMQKNGKVENHCKKCLETQPCVMLSVKSELKKFQGNEFAVWEKV